jgi:serine acetyltransferase
MDWWKLYHLTGVTIGDNSIVVEGSGVKMDVPANTIVSGNPAKILKQIINSFPFFGSNYVKSGKFSWP